MATLKVVGIDGALNNFGVAVGRYNTNTKKLEIDSIYHISEKRDKGKSKSLADVDRIKTINRKLKRYIRGADVIFAELVGGSQSSAAAWSLGVTMGILGSLNKEVLWVTPREAKKATGDPKASKREVINWATKKYSHLKWRKYRGRLVNDNEHAADACAILVSGLKREFD